MSETEQHTEAEAMYYQLVFGLLQAGMMQLGKIMNPVTKKTEKDLEGVRATIATLTMLRDKMKGNLSTQEEETLASALSSLQLNYVDEVSAAKGGNAKDDGVLGGGKE
ncbi:DUF1844 domain-containing protein [bacterium]|nr:DUF1844 domain-containing protein [bacterium]